MRSTAGPPLIDKHQPPRLLQALDKHKPRHRRPSGCAVDSGAPSHRQTPTSPSPPSLGQTQAPPSTAQRWSTAGPPLIDKHQPPRLLQALDKHKPRRRRPSGRQRGPLSSTNTSLPVSSKPWTNTSPAVTAQRLCGRQRGPLSSTNTSLAVCLLQALDKHKPRRRQLSGCAVDSGAASRQASWVGKVGLKLLGALGIKQCQSEERGGVRVALCAEAECFATDAPEWHWVPARASCAYCGKGAARKNPWAVPSVCISLRGQPQIDEAH